MPEAIPFMAWHVVEKKAQGKGRPFYSGLLCVAAHAVRSRGGGGGGGSIMYVKNASATSMS